MKKKPEVRVTEFEDSFTELIHVITKEGSNYVTVEFNAGYDGQERAFSSEDLTNFIEVLVEARDLATRVDSCFEL